MVGLSPGAISRKARTKGGLVTIITVLSLAAAMGATWFGLSANDHVAANYDAEAWLWSTVKGELARVNALTGQVDTRKSVPEAKGHNVDVSQSDRYLIMRDLSTGLVSSFDPATLSITSTMDTQQGVGINIALHNDAAFIIDSAQGVVRQLDPVTLQPIGEPLRFPPGVTGGTFDGLGRLWLAVPSEGTVTAITPAPLNQSPGGQGGGASPSQIRTEPVAEAWHDLVVSALDDGVAVLDQTNGTLLTLRGDATTKISTDAVGGQLADRSSGDAVPVTLIEGRQVYLVSGTGTNVKVSSFTVPGAGTLQPAVAFAGRVYIADDTNGIVYALDLEGKLTNTITFKYPGALQLEVRENHLFINSPGSSIAQVVNDKHEVKEVDKFRNDIVGGDPPIVPPPPPTEPPVTKPGPPSRVQATGGDNQVTLTWGKAPANGSRITKYIVSGNGQKWEVGANQRSLVIPGLVNGTEYVFEVSAVNGKGEGPPRKSNKVMPTREVPDPPTNVQAEAKPDGTVELTWTAANGQGHEIVRYEVTAITAGAGAPAGVNDGDNKFVIPDKDLDYGTQYSFTVVSINDIGASSVASTPVSNTVVPFAKPSAVKSLTGRTVPDQAGAVQFVWNAADDNGRPITGYEVEVDGRTITVTDTNAVVNGFQQGQMVTGKVRAVNEAGKGPESSATAKTITPATVSNVQTSGSPGHNSVVVKFAHEDGGGTATCTLTVNGAPRNIPCSSGAGGYTLNGLWPGNTYNYAVRVENKAGGQTSGNVAVRTPELAGRVTCNGASYCNPGIGVYRNSRQQSGEAVGNAYNGQRYRAFCKKAGMSGDQSGDAELYAASYNSNKRSSWWVQITFGGSQRYIPFIWINLDAGDNISMLPDC